MPAATARKKRAVVHVDSPPRVIINDPPKVEIPPLPPWHGLRVKMTREEFEARDWKEGDAARWKFEWNDGFAEAYEERMRLSEIKFMRRLPNAFAASPHGKQGAEMFCEVEIWLNKRQMRIPDLCVLTEAQIEFADEGGLPVPGFVIEVLSPSDQIMHVQSKVGEYFAAGVKVVWHVHRAFKTVTIYTGPTDAEIKHDHDICSAAPAFPKFKMKASDIFAAAKL
ncbi:MAG: Uma2 family endonuclease [Verrucomicrobiaceae bacterium]|nr:Uma2 family endonuclease [Verrucomicrobiaceae bacterium]